MAISYVWIFYVEDSGMSDRINITVMSDTYENAVRKIKAMQIPYLKSWTDIKDALKLSEVYEVEPEYDVTPE